MNKIEIIEGLWRVRHEHYCTDRYSRQDTIVKADSAQEAMDKLNAYLDTKPDGGYTALKCESINDVYPFSALI